MKHTIMIPINRILTHPGEILSHEFLGPIHVSHVELTKKMNVPAQRINTLKKGKRDIIDIDMESDIDSMRE